MCVHSHWPFLDKTGDHSSKT
uniref:Uncharacterized protein n=1 Tax=Anguilla anguilla TaxID=7936 RepID=A0A0E9V9H5_ANGAN